MRRSRRLSAEAPTRHDQLVKAMVGAFAPAHFAFERYVRQQASTESGAAPVKVPTDALLQAFSRAPRLGQVAWRIRWNREMGASIMKLGTVLLAEKLDVKRKGVRTPRSSPMLDIVAASALAEWGEGDCQTCNATGLRGDGKGERWVWIDCRRCQGVGRIPLVGVPWETRGEQPRLWHNLSKPCATHSWKDEKGKAHVTEGCGGVGRLRKLDTARQERLLCQACHGLRIVRLGEFQRAQNVGVSVDTYRARWAAKYGCALALLDQAEAVTARCIDIAIGKPQYRASEESYATSDDSYPPPRPEQEEAKAMPGEPKKVAHGRTAPNENESETASE